MSNFAHELFLLLVNLSQYKSRVLIIKVFVESLNVIFKPHTFLWCDDENDHCKKDLDVSTRTKKYGSIKYNPVEPLSGEILQMLQNAVQMLAMLLEKLEQEHLLKNQKEHLSTLVDKQTTELINKQQMLQLQVDEFETLNEELNQSNQQLILANQSTEESEKRFAFLAETAIEMAGLSSLKDIYAFAAQKINFILNGNNTITIVEFNQKENHWKMKHVEGVKKRITVASKFLGFNLAEAEGVLSTKYYEKIKSGKLEEIEFDLPGLFNNKITAAIGQSLRKVLSIEKMYCITFQQNTNIAGNITIFTHKKTEQVNLAFIEAFVSQLSVFVQKLKAKEALTESNELLLRSQEIAHLGSWKLDLKNNILTWSDEVYRILGCQPQEFTASYEGFLELFVHPDDRDLVDGAYTESVKQGKDYYELEHRIICKNTGEIRIVLEYCVHERDEGGEINGSVGMIQDITKQKQAEEALRESEERYLAFINASNDMIFIKNDQTRYLVANNAMATFFGVTKEGMIGKTDLELANKSKIYPCVSSDNKALQASEPFSVQELLGNRYCETTKFPVMLKNNVKGVGGIIRDITERRKTEDELRKISQAVEQSPASVVITDLDGTIEYVNPKFTEITGYNFDEAIGQNPRVLKSGKQDAEYYSNLWKTISSGKEWKGEFHNKRKDGELFWESATISPIVDEAGKATHYIAIKEDITYRKQAEEAEKNLEIARQTIRFKQKFLANMSHEIRTPLTGVLGMIDILENTSLSDTQKDYLDTIKVSGENLREIINQVLDYSKIEAGKATIKPHIFEFKSLPENALFLYKNNVKPGVKFQNIINQQIPAFIKADKSRLSQVLNNLVSNAVKFTSLGTITIQSSLISSDTDKGQVVIKIEVTDSGIGIPKDLQEKLFIPFSQIEDIDTRNHEGTGLGLSICRQLIEMMGGQSGLLSEEGKGSTFWFTFPALIGQAPEAIIQKILENTSNRPMRILLAEDKVVNQKVISLMLTAMGHKVEIVSDGQQALEHFEPGKFDLILMDIQMPVMDGVTATQKLKEKYDDMPPIVGLSANAFEGDREKYMEQGMDEYLTKPVKRDELKELFSKWY